MKKYLFLLISFFAAGLIFSCKQEDIEVKPAALEIETFPSKLNYSVKEKTDYTGLSVNMVYTDGSRKKISEKDYTVAPATKTVLSEAGNRAVKITADGMTAFFTISVKSPEQVYSSALEIANLPKKVSYFTNGTLDLTGLVVKIRKTDGTSKTLEKSEYTAEPSEGTVLSEDGSQPVKITADGMTTFFTVSVGKISYENLMLKSMPTKTYYKDDEKFDTTGMEVAACFNDGSERILEDWEYKISLENASSLQAGSGQEVTVSYSGKTVSFVINVGKKNVVSTWETCIFVDDYENNDQNSVGVKNHAITDICRGNTNLRSIKIPATVKSIDDYAFENCTALEEIDLSESNCETIGKKAFYNCKSLKTIKFSKNIGLIYDSAFENCENLSGELYFPRWVILYTRSFANCKNITSVRLADGSLGMGNYGDSFDSSGAFINCTSLKTVTCEHTNHDPITYACMNGVSFEGCTALKEITNPSGGYFENCTALKEVKNVSWWFSFKNCTQLENVEFTSDCTIINREAFYGCTSLANINIPRSIKYIESNAFAYCTKLTTIQIPYMVKELYLDSFYGCENLQEVKINSEDLTILNTIYCKGGEYLKEHNIKLSYEGTKAQFNAIDLLDAEHLNGVTICCQDGSFIYGE